MNTALTYFPWGKTLSRAESRFHLLSCLNNSYLLLHNKLGTCLRTACPNLYVAKRFFLPAHGISVAFHIASHRNSYAVLQVLAVPCTTVLLAPPRCNSQIAKGRAQETDHCKSFEDDEPAHAGRGHESSRRPCARVPHGGDRQCVLELSKCCNVSWSQSLKSRR